VRRILLFVVLLAAVSACGTEPTAPTTTRNSDVTGTWFPVGSSGPGLRLIQRGTTVEGTGVIPQGDPYPARMTVNGSVAGAEFEFSATAVSNQPDGEHVTLINGTLTVSSGTMTGMVSSVPQPPHATRPALTQVTFARAAAGQ